MKLSLTSKLSKKIEIFEQVNTQDEMGGSNNYWKKIQEMYAMIEPVFSLSNHQETFQAMQFITNNMLLYTIRFHNNITNKMRIKYKERFYSIIRIVNKQEKDISLQILTKEVVDEI